MVAESLTARASAVTSGPPLLRAGRGDRKSTRLNSSHANISYAVFCLKKAAGPVVLRLRLEYDLRRSAVAQLRPVCAAGILLWFGGVVRCQPAICLLQLRDGAMPDRAR